MNNARDYAGASICANVGADQAQQCAPRREQLLRQNGTASCSCLFAAISYLAQAMRHRLKNNLFTQDITT